MNKPNLTHNERLKQEAAERRQQRIDAHNARNQERADNKAREVATALLEIADNYANIGLNHSRPIVRNMYLSSAARYRKMANDVMPIAA